MSSLVFFSKLLLLSIVVRIFLSSCYFCFCWLLWLHFYLPSKCKPKKARPLLHKIAPVLGRPSPRLAGPWGLAEPPMPILWLRNNVTVGQLYVPPRAARASPRLLGNRGQIRASLGTLTLSWPCPATQPPWTRLCPSVTPQALWGVPKRSPLYHGVNLCCLPGYLGLATSRVLHVLILFDPWGGGSHLSILAESGRELPHCKPSSSVSDGRPCLRITKGQPVSDQGQGAGAGVTGMAPKPEMP